MSSPVPPAPARTAIILVNWNSWRDCVECLSSIYGSDAANAADVYLVDNQSSDGSVENIVDWCTHPKRSMGYPPFDGVRHAVAKPRPCQIWQANGAAAPLPVSGQLTVVRSGGNLGFAGGNNVGITAAGLQRYSHFWLLNTDTVIRHDALAHLLVRAATGRQVGIVGSTLIYYHQPHTVQGLGGARMDARTLVTAHLGIGRGFDVIPSEDAAVRALEAGMAYVIGASMLVSAAFVRDVGPMCEDYFLYGEELDWAQRGAAKGYTLAYAPHSVVFHKEGGSSEKVASVFSQRLFYRNRLRVIGRFFPERKWPALLHMVMELPRHVARGRFTRARLLLGTLLQARRLLRS